MATETSGPSLREPTGGTRFGMMVKAKTMPRVERPSLGERVAQGRAARAAVPRSSHAAWEPQQHRPDPVALLEEQARSRIPNLVPIRHGRMLVSPFAYFRGAAAPMAADLAATPSQDLSYKRAATRTYRTFGTFGSAGVAWYSTSTTSTRPHPAPWEWDVKRLAASLEVAARENQFSGTVRDRIVRRATRSYRQSMHEFAAVSMLEVWYSHLDMDDLLPRFRSLHRQEDARRLEGHHEGAREGQPPSLQEAVSQRQRRASDHQRPAAPHPGRGAAGRPRP